MPAPYRFTTSVALRDFNAEMSQLVRAADFATAESRLRGLIAGAGGPVVSLAGDLDLGAVTIDGWNEVYADMIAAEAKGHQITAMGIDLTGHFEGDEAGFEVAFYDDEYFPFSSATREEIAAACAKYGAPWTGNFIVCQASLETRGLAPLKRWIDAYPHRFHQPGPDTSALEHYDAFQYAQWLLYTAVHAALARELAIRGLPKPMPVVVGEHDFGPFLAAVYMVDKAYDRKTRTETERVLAARRAAAQAHYDKVTEEFVTELRDARAAIRGWPWWRNPGKRKLYIDYRKSSEVLLLRRFDLTLAKPTWKLSDPDFEAVIARLREARRMQQQTNR